MWGDVMRMRVLRCVFVGLSSWIWATEVPFVENGIKPRVTPVHLELVEVFRVGPDDDDPRFLWTSEQTGLAVNPQGHVFVTDVAENRVIELDEHGTFVRQIGRAGEGPGEFRALRSLHFLADGTAVAFENFQTLCVFNRFDASMEFVSRSQSTRFDRILKGVVMDPCGDAFFSTFVGIDRNESSDSVTSGILDSELNVLQVLSTTRTSSLDPQRINEPQYWSGYLAVMLEENAEGKSVFVVYAPDGGFFSAVANQYEITQWNPALEPVRIIRKKIDPVPFSDRERQAFVDLLMDDVRESLPESLQRIVTDSVVKRAVERAEFPPFKNPISGLQRFGDTLIVIGDVDRQLNTSHNDLFDSAGTFIGSFDHTFFGMLTMVFFQDVAYSLERNDAGDTVLVAYRVRLKRG